MSLGYIKEAMYQFSELYLHGKWSNSWGGGAKQNVTHGLTDSLTECSFINIDCFIFVLIRNKINHCHFFCTMKYELFWLLRQKSVKENYFHLLHIRRKKLTMDGSL